MFTPHKQTNQTALAPFLDACSSRSTSAIVESERRLCGRWKDKPSHLSLRCDVINRQLREAARVENAKSRD
jgi:hypothetical protein